MYELNIGGSEWVILVLLFLILVVGSKHLPELGRSLGKAFGEYEKAKTSVRREMERITGSSRLDSIIPIDGPVSNEREKLEIVARSLGIDPKDKGDDELKRLIMDRLGKQK
jgi:sec-independent protein translocase protein TatA